MFRKLWIWLNQARYFDVYVPKWIDRFINRKALLEESRHRMQIMKEEMLKKKIQDYYETIDFKKVDIPSFLKAEDEIKRLKAQGLFEKMYQKAMEEEMEKTIRNEVA